VPPALAWKRPGLPIRWVRVVQLDCDGKPSLAGYVLVDMGGGKIMRVWETHLEFREETFEVRSDP
jgi:endonuclease/exonuclease/phosphatase family metal-dependent hydrolase